MCNVIQGALKWCKRELDSRVMWSDCVWIDDNDNDRRHSIRLDEAQLMAVYVTCCYEEMFRFDAFVESWIMIELEWASEMAKNWSHYFIDRITRNM